jgi:hypothetical protein
MSEDKPTPEELGKLVEELAQREEWAGVDTLSDAEREARLDKSGIDRDKARAIGDRVHAKIEATAKTRADASAEKAAGPKAEPPAAVVRLDDRRRERFARVQRYATFAVAACVLLGIGVWLGRTTDDPRGVAGAFDGGPNYHRMRKLQQEARDAFQDHRYARCLEKLDEAKALGAYENDEDASMRRDALAALAREAGAGESSVP